MSLTTSSTLLPDLVTPLDQTLSIDQIWVVNNPKFGNTVEPRHFDLINTLSRFRESTGDGGVLLRSRFPKLKMTFRFHSGYIITNVPQATLSEELLTKISSRLLAGERISETAPHLEAIQWIKKATGLTQDRIGRLIGVTRQTINNWENGVPIADINRRRLFAVRDVLERAALRHSTPAQLVAWLDTPRGTDGHTPAELLEMNEINRARLLAVSSPSPHLVRAPAWVKRPVPEAFRAGAERRQVALPPDSDEEIEGATPHERN